MHFLDANVILRYITRDHPDHSARAYAFLQRVEAGEIDVTITEAVLAEVVHVLSSKVLYNVPRAVIQDQLVAILTLKGMRLRAKGRYVRALEIYAATNLDFVDALLVAQVEQTKDAVVVSFDRDYGKMPSVTREEP
jgi:predicted nucleic acid-binding protein